jgi:hypothetical protein
MKVRNVNAITIIGFILIILTVLLFSILPEKRTFIDWIGICFILLAEIEFYRRIHLYTRSSRTF